MRFSVLVAGAAGASALSIPDMVQKATQFVDLGQFGQMPTAPIEEAMANAGHDKVWKPEEVQQPPMKINAADAGCTNPQIRYEWRKLTDQHKADFIKAAKCLFGKPAGTGLAGATNRHMDMAAVHQQATPNVHNVGQFLPYHRYYLWTYERLLREECGYTGPMTWWDETKDAGNFQHAPMFTQAYFGNGVPKTSSGQGTCITSGAFGSTTLTVGPGSGNTNHCLARAVDNQGSANVNTNYVNSCNSHNNYTEMWQCSYLGPHGIGHNSVGAVMADMYGSPGDPIFFLHHGFIDRNWRIWQNANKNDRLYQMNGCNAQSGPCKPTTLDYTLSSRGIRPDVKIRDVMDTMGGTLCYKYDY